MNWKRILIGSWSWKRPLYSVASIYLVLAILAFFFADKLIFLPPGETYPGSRNHFEVTGAEGKEVALYYHPASEGMPTLLWSHGNAQNIGQLKVAMDSLNFEGFGILAYDYPGYGESAGKPSEKECYRSAKAAYDFLVSEKKCPAEKIILVGQSVGSGPTCWLAAHEEHGAVALISPFLSAFRTATKVPLFLGDRFLNLDRIVEFETPLLIIHGEEDSIVPFSHGERLFELSPSENKTFLPVEGGDHNDLFVLQAFDLGVELRKLLK